jgi:hypothetical protein
VSLLHKAVLAVSLVFAVVWTVLFYRIAFPRRRKRLTCRHRWVCVEAYASGGAKVRCRTCGTISLVNVPGSSPADPTRAG